MIKVLKYILVTLNVLAVLMMLVCAYSVYLHPVHYPNWSYFGMLFPIPLIVNVAFFFVWIFRPKTRYFLIPLAGMFLCMGAIKALLPINPFQGFNDGNYTKAGSDEIRFTQSKDGKILYVADLAWPKDHRMTVKNLKEGSPLYPEKIKSVKLLGYGKVKFTRTNDALVIDLPEENLNRIMPVVKIEK